MLICSVRDSALDAFMQPFVAQSRGQAIRSFTDAVNDGSTPMNKHPSDYELFVIGTFDEDIGEVKGHTPISLLRGVDAVEKKGD